MGASHGNCGTGTTKEGSPHNGPTALTHPEVAVWYRYHTTVGRRRQHGSVSWELWYRYHKRGIPP